MRANATRLARAFGWAGATLVVVLAGRTLAYGLQPRLSPGEQQLADATGGPSLLVVTGVTAAIAVGAAVAVVWLASIAVSERQRLEPRSTSNSKGVSTFAVVVRATSLFVASSAVFATLESYIHWRAGLGWHGLHCLVGPAHRDAIPILAALSIVAAAVLKAAAHIFAWMRRVVLRLRNRPRGTGSTTVPRRPRSQSDARRWLYGVSLGARGPPSFFLVGRLGRTSCGF